MPITNRAAVVTTEGNRNLRLGDRCQRPSTVTDSRLCSGNLARSSGQRSTVLLPDTAIRCSLTLADWLAIRRPSAESAFAPGSLADVEQTESAVA